MSVKRVELNRPRPSGLWAENGPGFLSQAHHGDVFGDDWEPIAAATRRSNRQPSPDLTPCPLCRHPIVLHDTSIPDPISREFRHGAVGTLVSGHEVSGAGWQTPGRVMQPTTTMMPVRQCGHCLKDRPVRAS